MPDLIKLSEKIFNNTADYLFNKIGRFVNNDPQIEAISKRAFENLNIFHPEVKDLSKQVYANSPNVIKDKNRDEILLEESIKKSIDEVLVSGKSPWNPNLKNLTPRQQMIFDIVRGTFPSIENVLNDTSLLPAIALKKNQKLLDEARALVHDIFLDMERTINNPHHPLTESESFHMEVIIGDLLSLYPFLRPQDNEPLAVPMRVEGRWTIVTYNVKKISLTPRWMGSPITAYGLTPHENPPKAPPLLLFKGTTYPTDKGFGLSLLTDINPLDSVGSYVYGIGKKEIEKWFTENTSSSKKAIIYGKSLGGAHAWRTGIQFDNVEKVMAYGAPGLSNSDLKQLKEKQEKGNLPEINIFCQRNDPVPYFDRTAKMGIKYYQVIGTANRQHVLAHADMFSTHKNSVILTLDTSKKSSQIKRIAFTALRGGLSIFAFPFLLLIFGAYTLSERAVHNAYRHWHPKRTHKSEKV